MTSLSQTSRAGGEVCGKSSTNRIRIELAFGALTLRELADRCGMTGSKATERIIPLVWQMVNRTQEVVQLKGRPNKYALKRQHTALQEWR